MSSGPKLARLVGYAAAFVVLLIVIGILLFESLYVYNIIPISAHLFLEEAVAIVFGVIIITILGKEIGVLSSQLFGHRRATMIFVVYRFVAYVALALVLLGIAGVSGTDLLAGGAFAGLVFGLAAQTVLSNIIAGIMIVLARPYQVGDRITFVSGQYSLIAPSYPPKFFSQDFLAAGYSGQVGDINLAYTVLQMDDGPSMKVPNSVMVAAAVISHEVKERWVKTKYEVPSTISPDIAIEALRVTLSKNKWIVNPESIVILVNSTTPASYVISIDILCKGNMEDQPRSSILIDVMNVIGGLVKEQQLLQQQQTEKVS
jgi:small conductance mechanosensitive channel